jgi:outer membrane lipoprotein-sorting protein
MNMRSTLFLFIAVFSFTTSSISQVNPREILRKAEEHTRGDRSYAEVTMEIVRPRFTRTISMRSWAMGEEYSLILITAPARDRGIAYLKRQNEIWNWMPSIDRLIKLPPSMMGQSWMGSDFTNDDLVRESSVIDDYTHKLLGQEVVEGRTCYKIEMTPKPDKPIVWGKVIVWIAEDPYIQLKTEQYDEKGKLINRIEFSDIKTFDGREVPTKMTLTPLDKSGHKTILTQHKMDFNPTIDEDFFSIQNLQRVR